MPPICILSRSSGVIHGPQLPISDCQTRRPDGGVVINPALAKKKQTSNDRNRPGQPKERRAVASSTGCSGLRRQCEAPARRLFSSSIQDSLWRVTNK